jgi:uncharacterized caspase-like protein
MEHVVSESFAVAIGLQKYQQPTITGVNYAHDDAKAMAKVFEDRFAVPSGNIQVWLDDQATAARLANDLAYTVKNVGSDDRFYFFYAGHGLWFPKGGNRLTVYDTQLVNLEGTTIGVEDLLLDPLRAAGCKTVALFIDACAQDMTKGGSRDLLADMRKEDFEQFAKDSKCTAAFFACSPKEKSYSSQALKHGIWTYHLERALRGLEPNAVYKDKFVTNTSLQNYLLDAVKKFTRDKMTIKASQTPYATFHHAGTVPLVTLPDPVAPAIDGLLNPDFSEAYFMSQEIRPFRSLPGFNSKMGHKPPSGRSERAASWAGELLADEIGDELQMIVNNAKDILELRYRDLTKGADSVDADAFRYSVQVGQSNTDYKDAVVRRSIELRTPSSKLPEDFDDIFPHPVDTLVVPLRSVHGKFAVLRDAIEDRGIEIEDADETKETIKFAIGDARITINTDRERMTVRVLGKSGTLPLIEAIGGDGVPEIAGPAPKLIGKKKSKD